MSIKNMVVEQVRQDVPEDLLLARYTPPLTIKAPRIREGSTGSLRKMKPMIMAKRGTKLIKTEALEGPMDFTA